MKKDVTHLLRRVIRAWPARACPCGNCDECEARDYLRDTDAKIKADTGGGCSICGALPAVNVTGTYWLCGPCVLERQNQLTRFQDQIAKRGNIPDDWREQVNAVALECAESTKRSARELSEIDFLRAQESAINDLFKR